ncbi:MAG: hypothetical protein QME51_07060 [Planctomycetota bacterium]|nr:hypothetical protein [Planctomycetota bacterium]MDI6788113.1 hypothetical protein [Planctomycetota bacterium]
MEHVSGWYVADSVVAFLFSCATTVLLVFLVWRVVNRLLSGFLGRSIGFFGAFFSAVLIGVTGVKIASDFLGRYKKLPIIQGVISGIADTVNACITPKLFSPFEFIIVVGLALYVCYWLHTRFAPKHPIDDIKDKFEHTIDPDLPPKPPYQY